VENEVAGTDSAHRVNQICLADKFSPATRRAIVNLVGEQCRFSGNTFPFNGWAPIPSLFTDASNVLFDKPTGTSCCRMHPYELPIADLLVPRGRIRVLAKRLRHPRHGSVLL